MPHLRKFGLATLILFAASVVAAAQNSSQSSSSTSSQQQQQKPQQQQQAAPAEGGPSGDLGPMAMPKKAEPAPAPPPAPAAPKVVNPPGLGIPSLRVEVPEVTVDVGVLLEKTHQFVPNLKPENFRVYEDGVEQKVIGFKRVQAPITALLLCEFSSTAWPFIYDMRNAAWAFAEQLRPQDYVALMTFDLRTQIITDFTQDKRQLLEAINMLQIPGFTDRDLFDALSEAEDRLSRIPGRKYIILIASGRDTFSHITFDQILKKVKETPNITIFTISTGGGMRAMTEGMGGMGAQMRDMDYLQADNEMRTFAKVTGGASYFPRFTGEMPDIFSDINSQIRSKYQLVYRPTNAKQDGTWRKIRVELVDDEGHPLQIQDRKHHRLKYDVIARDGYRAKPAVE